MATHVRHPILIAEAPRSLGARSFAALYTLESLARATLVTVLPLTAFALLKEAALAALLAVTGWLTRTHLPRGM
ncbi:MAG TPA: hypothetical protein VM891_05460 [Amaricoccus sp.]|jgi:hypothetical protein|nr:hypothetical protein [Amaricoccus sp.]